MDWSESLQWHDQVLVSLGLNQFSGKTSSIRVNFKIIVPSPPYLVRPLPLFLSSSPSPFLLSLYLSPSHKCPLQNLFPWRSEHFENQPSMSVLQWNKSLFLLSSFNLFAVISIRYHVWSTISGQPRLLRRLLHLHSAKNPLWGCLFSPCPAWRVHSKS